MTNEQQLQRENNGDHENFGDGNYISQLQFQCIHENCSIIIY